MLLAPNNKIICRLCVKVMRYNCNNNYWLSKQHNVTGWRKEFAYRLCKQALQNCTMHCIACIQTGSGPNKKIVKVFLNVYENWVKKYILDKHNSNNNTHNNVDEKLKKGRNKRTEKMEREYENTNWFKNES